MGKHNIFYYRRLAVALLLWIAVIACGTLVNPAGSAAHSANYDPVVIHPNSMVVTHDTSPTVVMQAPAGLLITLYKDDAVVGLGLGDGTEPVSIELQPLGRGVHNITARTSLPAGPALGETRLPKIVIDDGEPFDISDIVKFTPELYEGDSPGFRFNTVFSSLMETVSPKEALVSSIAYSAEPGTVAGTTKLNVPTASSNLHVKVSSAPLSTPGMGSLVPSGAMAYQAGSNISGVDPVTNKYIGLYENGEGGVIGFASIVLLPEQISEITTADALTSVELIRSSTGQFQVNVEPDNAALSKEDFSVTVRSSGMSVNIQNFIYDSANRSITLGEAVVDSYNRIPIDVTIAASPTTSKITGTYTVSALLGDIQGTVRREVSGEPGSGITVSFREGLNNQTGPVVATAVTSADGIYSVRLDPGEYTVELGGTGVVTSFFTRALVLHEGSDPANDFIVVMESPSVDEIVSVTLIRPSIGQFEVNLEPAVAELRKEDFTVTVDTYSEPVSIDDFMYDSVNRRITLGESVVDSYNRIPIDVTIAASPTTSKITGTYTVSALLGDIQGTVRREVSEEPVSGITVSFREGLNNQTGPVVATAVTSADGIYSVRLDPGPYTVELNGSGYVTGSINRSLVLREGDDAANDFIVVGIPEGEQARIVLTWGQHPEDLDSHLFGPTHDGGSFHIYYGNKQYTHAERVYASLDMDVTEGYGPETTTITTVVDSVYGAAYGTYSFQVHQWTESSSVSLSLSGARVEVYMGDSTTPLHTYNVPITGIGERYWNVFDMILNESGISFVHTGTLTEGPPNATEGVFQIQGLGETAPPKPNKP